MADISKITAGSTTYNVKDAGAARSGHTHTTSIASSSATNQITLSASTKYAITAGGTSYVFTTPPDTNTWRPIGTGATDAAAGNHTHSTSIAASSGTNQVTLAANTKYAITAGGTSYVFTTPPDTNTWRPQTDWNAASTANNAILNKPSSLPASDVYAWAKASTKPSYTASEVGALKNYGNNASRPNGTTFTLPNGANPVQMRSGATSGADIGIFHLSDDNAFVCNSSDNSYLFAAFDTDKTANFSSADNAAFVVLSDHAGVKMKGDLTVGGSITSGGTAVVLTNDSRMTNARPASDVYAWAKASSKPSYTASEVGAVPTSRTVNGKALSSNITLTAADVGAATTDTKNTVGSSVTEDRIYFVGVKTYGGTSQTSYATDEVYVESGIMYAGSLTVGAGGLTTDGLYVEDSSATVDNNLTVGGSITSGGTAVVLTNDSRMTNARPASDVYSWAKASTKPSYAHNEISPGNLTVGDGANYVLFRTAQNLHSGMYYHTSGNEAMVFGNQYGDASWIFAYTDPSQRTAWTSLTPALQIKNQCVNINKLIGHNVTPSYNLDVNGTANVTTIYENGSLLSAKYAPISHTHSYAGSSSAGGAATSANKLNTDKGSATNPVYFSGGVPVACTYSLNKTVPSDAKFTDTVTTATTTGSGNAVTAISASNGALTVTKGSTFATTSHTHTTSIATTSDTNQITLAANTKYKLTAGGTSYVFTTPSSGGGGGSMRLESVWTGGAHAASASYDYLNFDITVSPSYMYYIVPMLHLYSDSSYDVGSYLVNCTIYLEPSSSQTWNTIIGSQTKVIGATYEDHQTHPQASYTDGWLYMSDPFQDDNTGNTSLKGTVRITRNSSSSSLDLTRLWWTLNVYKVCLFDPAEFPMD